MACFWCGCGFSGPTGPGQAPLFDLLDGGGGDLGALFRARHGPEGAAAPAEKLGRQVRATEIQDRNPVDQIRGSLESIGPGHLAEHLHLERSIGQAPASPKRWRQNLADRQGARQSLRAKVAGNSQPAERGIDIQIVRQPRDIPNERN